MFIGESSRSGVNSLASTNEILQHSVNNNTLHSDVPVVSDVPTTATSLIQHTSRPAASVNPATSIHAQTPHNKSLTNNVRVNTAVKLDSPASSKINESVVDLSGIFTPLTVMDLAPNAYATYPPTSRTWQPPKPTQLNIPLPTQSYIVSKPTPTASATPQSGKENLSPNRLPKRISKGTNLRQTLKRCMGNPAQLFEKLWLHEEEATDLIQQHWKPVSAGNAAATFLQNISSCADSLQHWHTKNLGTLKRRFQKCKRK
ncbi:hypothetical protein CsatA_015476 [Cannabis sativa]